MLSCGSDSGVNQESEDSMIIGNVLFDADTSGAENSDNFDSLMILQNKAILIPQ